MHLTHRTTVHLLIALCAVPCAAQPTLSAGQLAREVGDVFLFASCGPAGFPATGAGLTWYYSSLTCGEGGSVNVVDPAGTVGAAYFPTATAADQSVGFPDAMYYRSTATEELRLGYYATPGQNSLCTDPQTEMVYPFTYGSTFTDSMVCVETSVYDRTRSGTNTVTAVGYGAVVLPYGTFTDCLLLHRHWSYVDAYDQLVPGYVEGDSYSFVKPGLAVPLYSVSYSTYTQDGGTIVNQGSSLLNELSTGVRAHRQEAGGLVLWPNPARDVVMLQRTGLHPVLLELLTTDGRILRRTHLPAGTTPSPLAVIDLPAGLYLVRVTDADGTATARVVRE